MDVATLTSLATITDAKQAHNNLSENAELLAASSPQAILEALQNVDAHKHTVGCFHLCAVLLAFEVEPAIVLPVANRLLTSFDPVNVELCATKLALVVDRVAALYIKSGTAAAGITPLIVAMRKLQSSKDELTPVHAEVLKLCLVSKHYAKGMEIIQDDILTLSPNKTGLTKTAMMGYFYYAGMVCVGMKQMSKALEFFQLAFTTPTQSISAIMVEAYKKFVLVSLIRHGSVQPLSKLASPIIQKNLKILCKPYEELSTSFGTLSREDLELCMTQNREAFSADGNLGLVKQVIKARVTRKIQRLTQTYLTLSLTDIATQAGLQTADEAQHIILSMIAKEEIFARINQKDGMVSFLEGEEACNTGHMMEKLDSRIKGIVNLIQHLRDVDESLCTEPAFLRKSSQRDVGGGWGHGLDDMDERAPLAIDVGTPF